MPTYYVETAASRRPMKIEAKDDKDLIDNILSRFITVTVAYEEMDDGEMRIVYEDEFRKEQKGK